MFIAIGSDHRGVEMKAAIIRLLGDMGYQLQDVGAYDKQSVDYPDIARDVCEQITCGTCERGILICGTGIGMSIAANKVRGIRAALCCDTFMAERSRLHNNANVLCLGAEKTQHVEDIIMIFLTTSFDDGRHCKRLNKLADMQN
ncbi:MAG: ribose 5-phosphate isomerase B [Dehalococcoidia bacterium]|nr:ribose 5-phosphate isomerase B [Dehalococcoidia bacterium]